MKELLIDCGSRWKSLQHLSASVRECVSWITAQEERITKPLLIPRPATLNTDLLRKETGFSEVFVSRRPNAEIILIYIRLGVFISLNALKCSQLYENDPYVFEVLKYNFRCNYTNHLTDVEPQSLSAS